MSFRAVTVRVPTSGNKDLDGYWASVMAKELNFSHEVINMPSVQEYAKLDRLRRVLTDGLGCDTPGFWL